MHRKHVRLCVHCNNFGYISQQDNQLMEHIFAEQHGIDNENVPRCGQCGNNFNLYSPKKRHMHRKHVRLCVHCNNCEFNEQQDQEIKSHVSAEQDRIGNQQLLCEQCSVHWNFYSPMKTCMHREHVRLKYVCLSCEFNIKIENALTEHIGCVRFVPLLCFHWFQVHGSEVLIQLAIFEVNIQHMLTIQFLTGNSIVMSNSLFLNYNLSP